MKRPEALEVATSAAEEPDEVEQRSALLEAVLAAGAPRAEAATEAFAPLLGECVDAEHPTLAGRVQVRWVVPGIGRAPQTRWLACVNGVVVRRGDRVLLQRPANWPELIVTAVLDGFARRPARRFRPGPTIPLRRDESVRIRGEGGEELLELYQADSGPVVRLLGPDLDLELPGALRVRASQIALEATAGDVELRASDDVELQGERVRLN